MTDQEIDTAIRIEFAEAGVFAALAPDRIAQVIANKYNASWALTGGVQEGPAHQAFDGVITWENELVFTLPSGHRVEIRTAV